MLAGHNLCPRQEASDAHDAGRAGPELAAASYCAGWSLQPQLLSPARAADADDAGCLELEIMMRLGVCNQHFLRLRATPTRAADTQGAFTATACVPGTGS